MGHARSPSGHLSPAQGLSAGWVLPRVCFSSPWAVFPPLLLQEPPDADLGEEIPKDLQVFYLNPLYDASETET